MKRNFSKFFGTIMMVVGTTVGGGMLALPLVSYASGFTWSTILMGLIYCLSVFCSFMVLEINLGFPDNSNSFATMAKKTLGKTGQSVVWFVSLFLMYACITAYIVGESDIIVNYVKNSFNFKVSYWQSAILFTSLIGIIVDCSVRVVDYLNRVLVLLKGGLLIGALFLVSGHMDSANLFAVPLNNITHFKYLWLVVPVFVCAFNFHMIIPSLRSYYGSNVKDLKKIFVIGLLIVFGLYAWWSAAVLGVVPLHGDNSFAAIPEGAVGVLMQILVGVSKSSGFKMLVNGFANITLVTAFLGTALGLFDFLADGLKIPNTVNGRLKTAFLTFVPPLVVALVYPNAFVMALNYSAICVAVLIIIIPALMVLRSRNMADFKTPYRVRVGKPVIVFVLCIGIFLAALGMLYVMDLLPKMN